MDYPQIKKPELFLLQDIENTVKLFKKSKTIQDLATCLEVHPGHLKYWLYTKPSHKGYVEFEVPKKSGGVRLISVPPNNFKILQNKLKSILERIYKPKVSTIGFVKGQSIVSGAKQHKKKKWILNLDLENFFSSIHFGRVKGLFMSLGLAEKAATIISHLVTYNNCLPQGACTSPLIANMIARQLDNNLLNLCSKLRIKYTRYADDLSFSGNFEQISHIAKVDEENYRSNDIKLEKNVLNIISKCGFKINDKKTRILSSKQRQEVTGLTVNKFVNIKRENIRQIRAMVHAIEKYGWKAAAFEYIEKYIPLYKKNKLSKEINDNPIKYFKEVIYGKLAFLRMVRGKDDKIYCSYCLKLAELDDLPPKTIKEIKQMYERYDVFICHASQDKEEIANPIYSALTKHNLYAFLDSKCIGWGDSFVEKINHALSQAKIILVILSPNSIGKAWPQTEIRTAICNNINGTSKLLPLMVGTEKEIEDFTSHMPLISHIHYKKWDGDHENIAATIKTMLEARN